ncbi:Xenotropic and polytropic retrovirus receptor 1 [Rhizina undulata]
MKYAKTLEELMVPEWRYQYVDYKAGKKKIKAVTHSLRLASQASPSPGLGALRRIRTASTSVAQRHHAASIFPDNATRRDSQAGSGPQSLNASSHRSPQSPPTLPPPALPIPHTSSPIPESPLTGAGRPSLPPLSERSPLQPSPQIISRGNGEQGGFKAYGATISTPPQLKTPFSTAEGEENIAGPKQPPSLKLPAPIQPIADSPSNRSVRSFTAISQRPRTGRSEVSDIAPLPFSDANPPPPGRSFSMPVRRKYSVSRSVSSSMPDSQNTAATIGSHPFMRRVLSSFSTRNAPPPAKPSKLTEAQIQAEADFLAWLYEQEKKINEFYGIREKEAVARYEVMKEQLEVMRQQWIRERHEIPFEDDDVADIADDEVSANGRLNGYANGSAVGSNGKEKVKRRTGWKDALADTINGLSQRGGVSPSNEINKTLRNLEGARDYELHRRPTNNPAHRTAKRKLRRAYVSYYRGLEMLKSYVIANREGFRKITKKFDKASGLRTSSKFMNETINKSYFGGSENKLDDLMNDTEALFAKYFEKGNRKEAANRLRSRDNKSAYHSSVWRSGFLLGASLILGIYGSWQYVLKVNDPNDPVNSVKVGYILQIWAGAALILAQLLLFSINFRVWAKNKINYAFIFEFSPRHQLNYRQFLEIPAIFSFIFCVCYWFGAYNFWPDKLDVIYYPVIFLSLAGILLFWPTKAFYYYSRKWFLMVMWRLFLSGFYRVEFKDFWMGDMLCSQTYALGNVYLFFCLYGNHFNDPPMCNSSHSRMMGFLTCLPGIWRLLQCFRRYHDSRQTFPHLVNGGKYFCTILQYMTLSLWRVDKENTSLKALFIACATVNSTYCIVWDLAMDWSLLNPWARYPFLRDTLGFKRPWGYYGAMFIDPILRFNWVFYIIYAHNIQHSALLSFLLALAEVFRRFVWCFFRMENEHLGNVGAKRAYRDLPLPYHFPEPLAAWTTNLAEQPTEEAEPCAPPVPIAVAEAEVRVTSLRLRTRPSRSDSSPAMKALGRMGQSMTTAHLKDYERKRHAGEEEEEEGSSSDDEDSDDYYERTARAEGMRGSVGSV